MRVIRTRSSSPNSSSARTFARYILFAARFFARSISSLMLCGCPPLPLIVLEHFNKERRNWRELEALSSKAMGLMNLSGGMDAIGFGAGVIDQYAVVPELDVLPSESEGDVDALKEMSGRLQKFQQQVKKLCCRMQDVRREARQAQDALLDLSDYLTDGIKDIRDIRSESGNDWKNYSESQKIIIGRTTQVAHLISVLSEVRFLTDEADLRGEIREALEATEELLDELGV